ncbi:MAG TPA: LacI family DNA-binding transcriptional regulator, partial [Chloroflexota bacterium]|nr:LacI family DNA-binding transcriptional regulator [Chloroflexota bacterium]
MSQRPTVSIKDVARAANVSFQTVSRALRQSGYVGPETRARIEAAVQQLGYRPNANARALVRRTSDVIAIVLPSDVAMMVRNP